jgi:uncharacterized protein (DUF1800 family)
MDSAYFSREAGLQVGLTVLAATPFALAAASATDRGSAGVSPAGFADERSRIAHLLRRAGFGASPSELEAAVARGYDATLDQLLTPTDDHDAAEDALQQVDFDLTKLNDSQRWWLVRMRYTSRPLVEKMALFWHGHFATGVSKVGIRNLALMRQQNDLFRSSGLGGFGDLLLSISQDPAMLIWLDGRQNHRNAPNENYGRELMELFTLGIGNYSEDDVKAAARAFTGWSLDRDLHYVFNTKDHDTGSKTFLGQTGAWNGDDIIRILLTQPAAAQFLARKLVRFFVSDPPDQGLVDSLAGTLRSSNYDMRTTLRALFKSDAFSGAAAYHALIKSPAEFVVGALRTLNVGTNGLGLPVLMNALGQALFNPPNVAGWPGGVAWIATNTLLARDNFANVLASVAKPGNGFDVDIQTLLNLPNPVGRSDLLDAMTRLLVDGDLTSDERGTLQTYLGDSDTVDVVKDGLKLRGLLYLTLGTPVYNAN